MRRSSRQAICIFYSKTLTPTKVVVIVKSDNYKSLWSAASLLGWKSEKTLANRWPQHAVHEPMHQTFLAMCRAHMRQSRLPIPGWSVVQGFASIMLTVTRLAPKLPDEFDVSGESLERYKEKTLRHVGRSIMEERSSQAQLKLSACLYTTLIDRRHTKYVKI